MIFYLAYWFYVMGRFVLDSIIFPYTTLFRSMSVVEGLVTARMPSVCHLCGSIRQSPNNLRTSVVEPCIIRGKLQHCQTDRKSTRLNSSHVANSYVVFCLKKKMSMPQY